MESSSSRVEAERLLGISEKLLRSRDLNGSRDFAVLAQETEPLLDGSDQILAVVDVLLAGDRRVNNHHDWYAILQAEPRSDDDELLKRNYRRLALLLHPDKNQNPFADQAFRLVSQAWGVISDQAKKALYDHELTLFSRVNLAGKASAPPKKAKPVKLQTFWTVCPYCYVMYEYPRVYEECCLKCEKCRKAFHASEVEKPPVAPGEESYYCAMAFFPLQFSTENVVSGGGKMMATNASTGMKKRGRPKLH